MSQILLVDDEAVARNMVGAQLERLGHTVFTAASVGEAKAVFSENSIDMAIVDLRLGKESGLGLLPVFREQAPDCQVVMITAYASVDTAAEAMRLGASDYLVKPVQPHDLVRVTKRCLEHKKVLEENRRLEEENRQYRERLEKKVRKQTAELREYDERYHSLIKYSPTAVYVFDDQMHFIEANPAGEKLLGYSRDELLSMSIPQADVDPEAVKPAHEQLKHGDSLINYEHQLRRKDGKIITVLNNSVALKDASGKITNWFSFLMDITERRQAEEALQESESRYRSLVEYMPDGIVVHCDGKIVYVNPAALCIIGAKDADDIIGRDIMDFVPSKTRQEILKRIDSIQKENMTQPAIEEMLVRLDGSPFMAKVSAIPISFNGRKATQVVLCDITERKKAEKALKEIQMRYEEAQEIAHIGHWMLDLTTGALSWSDEVFYIFGMDPDEESTYEKFLEAVHPDDREILEKAYTESVKNRTSYNIEHRLLMKDGTVKWVNERCKTWYDEKGLPLRSVGTVMDITEQKHLEEQLRHAQKMEALGTLVGGIAHDFNNMLAGITGNVYLAIRQSENQPEVIKKLRNVEKLSFRAAEMINQLLAFARKSMTNMQPISLLYFIKEAIKLAQVSVPENIHLRHSFCGKDMVVMGDITQLQQVLMNLLSNARDAVADHSRPEISIKLASFAADENFRKAHPDLARRSLARLTVSDNGRGIPADHLENIFEPFFTTKEVGKGTGLGLAMVYGTVQSHGGVVRVESEVGKGTSFHIYLPLVDAKVEPVTENWEEYVRGHGETLLLADDEVHVREAGKAVLESLGYKVLEAYDGKNAVELFKAHVNEITLVILDVVMPRMGGIEAAREIREIRPDIPIIAATGYDREDTIGEKYAEYCDIILSKPFTVMELSQNLHALLSASEQESC